MSDLGPERQAGMSVQKLKTLPASHLRRPCPAQDFRYFLEQFIPASSKNPNTTISVQEALDLLNPTDKPANYDGELPRGDNRVTFGAAN